MCHLFSTARGREVNIHLLCSLTGALFNGNSLISLSAISWNGTNHFTDKVHNFKTFVFQEYIVKYRYIMVQNFKAFDIPIVHIKVYKYIMVHDFKLIRRLVFQEYSKVKICHRYVLVHVFQNWWVCLEAPFWIQSKFNTILCLSIECTSL